MNNRQKELLRILLTGSSDFFHVQELSNELGCSEKTVRSDLNRIETFLKEYPAVELIRKRGTGIHLSIHHADRVKLFHHIYQTGKIAAGHERVLEVAYQLLTSDNPLTLASLAESYFTNPTSMKHELNRIAHWLEGYHLTLMSKQRLGHIVKGRELDKRNALANLSELIPSENREKDRILQLFPQNETATVRKLLRGLQVDYPIDLTEGEFESLLIHVLIMIKRTRQRSSIVLGEMDAGANVKLETYHMTAWFLKRLGDALGVSFPENEYVYFTWHLESCRKKNGLTNLKADDLLADVVRQMTLQLQHMTMIRFREDKVLADGLVTHLASALHRIRYGLTIRNPMLSDIKKKYPYMLSMVILAVEKVNEAYDLDIAEDEAAYLVLHFQASIERMQQERTPVKRNVIVCDLGVGMSHLLQAKLAQSYKSIDILGCISKAALNEFVETHEIDLIISTTGINDCEIPKVEITPLLETDDKKRLNQVLQSMERELADRGEMFSTIKQLLNEDTIYFDIDLKHRFEVVEMLASNLVGKGFAETSFVHSAMLREQTSATAIGGGIAIPHAHPDLVKKSVVSIAVLHEPLEWGSEVVWVVFMLSIAKADQHMTKSLMQTIASISEKPAAVEHLKKANSVSDILTVFDQ